MKRTLIWSQAFVRAVKRLAKTQPATVDALRQVLPLLEADAFHPSLKTHKLKGDMKDCWSCSAGHDVRIVFGFVKHEGAEAILLHTVGNHDAVY